MLKSILVGLFLTMVTVGIHAVGTEWLIRRLRKTETTEHGSISRLSAIKVLCFTAVSLLLLVLVGRMGEHQGRNRDPLQKTP